LQKSKIHFLQEKTMPKIIFIEILTKKQENKKSFALLKTLI